jgi:hypothetical protein
MISEDGSWFLTGLVLAAAQLAAKQTLPLVSNASGFSPASMILLRVYQGIGGEYQIFGIQSGDGSPSPLVNAKNYRLYLTQLPSGRVGLLKLAATADDNPLLEHEWCILTDLHQLAFQYDQQAIANHLKTYNYGAMFPEPLEKFDAEGRVALFVGFHQDISEFKQLSPLSVLLKDQRVDLQTSVWILGKLLKLLIFTHESGYTNRFIRPGNILVETALHGVFCLDWLYARDESESNPDDYVNDLQAAADLIWKITGGISDCPPPYDPDLLNEDHYQKFLAFLQELRIGNQSPREYQRQLYQLADQIWPNVPKASGNGLKRQFHLFQTYSLTK